VPPRRCTSTLFPYTTLFRSRAAGIQRKDLKSLAPLTSSCFLAEGVTTDRYTKKALQSLYCVFAANGLGQATFEVVPDEPTRLWLKHKDGIAPRRETIDAALARPGKYRVISEPDVDTGSKHAD